MSRREELELEGYLFRFIAEEPRLTESTELYKSLGFEVRLEVPDGREDDGECKACLVAQQDKYRAIYTRKRHSRGAAS